MSSVKNFFIVLSLFIGFNFAIADDDKAPKHNQTTQSSTAEHEIEPPPESRP